MLKTKNCDQRVADCFKSHIASNFSFVWSASGKNIASNAYRVLIAGFFARQPMGNRRRRSDTVAGLFDYRNAADADDGVYGF